LQATLTNNGNLLIGTTSETGLTGAGGLKINSSTAGSASAGALVVTGGLATGAASYIGGALKIGSASAMGYLELVKNGVGYASFIEPAQTAASTGNSFLFKNSGGSTLLTLAYDGAATFAGAVTIGNTVNTVSPTSPNRTITMVVNGVTLYLAAKTTND
jgi:hypothetical protein